MQGLGTFVRTILTGGSVPDAVARAEAAGVNVQGLDQGLTPPTPLREPLNPLFAFYHPVLKPPSHNISLCNPRDVHAPCHNGCCQLGHCSLASPVPCLPEH